MAVLKFKDEDNKWKEYSVVNDGVTFIPSIDDKGNLSWNNNGHLPNPKPINIMGDTLGMYDTFADFPKVGQGWILYIDKSNNTMYRWDATQESYVSIVGSGGGPTDGVYIKIVSVLPTTDIKTNVIYFVPNQEDIENNHYDEYMYIKGKWELVGFTNKGTLKLGDYSYDGTEDVDVPVYKGNYKN